MMSSSVHSWQSTPSAGPLSTKVFGPCVSPVLSLPLSPKAPIEIPKQGQVKKGAQKGVTTSQCAGTTRWTCAGDTTANTHTSVHGAKVHIQGTNAPTKDSLPLQKNQNGGQKYNAPIHDHDLGFVPRSPLLKNENDPLKPFEKIPIAPQADNFAVRAPPQHVESPTPATSWARTPPSSHPGRAQVALSSTHAPLATTKPPLMLMICQIQLSQIPQ